ncbi:MAG: hypothetical protein DMD33_19785 [Gemmatimonadetes bacterium]|nr:MAG: hypothetical protein DMD33_19785 [Gemmatimonadota bacterium]
MTNIRITDESVPEWLFCPYCGRKLEHDQDADLLVRSYFGIDSDASADAGFDFDKSLSHCGFHIRLWVPEDGESEIE